MRFAVPIGFDGYTLGTPFVNHLLNGCVVRMVTGIRI